ncbi:flagellar basal body L-ring protein FlgH [Oceaniserpentilla sp. 4NH20-0058]|uniref:flagellar basal body L-ring protein FlgH n=1 Tax=Oceaniserpentilla sp. 4NH20-0058 TaxID=3127660 RepID=UPI003103AFBC
MKSLITGSLMLVLAGCASVLPIDEKPNDPRYSPVPAQSLTPPPTTDGSLYQSNYSMSLFSDQRAKRIGDVITVVLQEQTQASKSNSATTKKDSDLNLGDVSIFTKTPPILSASAAASRAFTGTGDADQSNSLRGQITVTISDILPNGVLEVRGEKWLTLNRGDEFIRVRGLVRAQDIGPDNTVMSTKLADARISYGGTGEVANASRQGLLTRFFSSPWWPF